MLRVPPFVVTPINSTPRLAPRRADCMMAPVTASELFGLMTRSFTASGESEEAERVVAEETTAEIRREVGGLERGDGVVGSQAERVVAAEDDAVAAEGFEDQCQPARRVCERVDPDTARAFARGAGDGRPRLVHHAPSVIEAGRNLRKGATAVREAPADARPSLEDAAEDQSRHAERRLQREADHLGQVLDLDAVLSRDRRLRMHEDRH